MVVEMAKRARKSASETSAGQVEPRSPRVAMLLHWDSALSRRIRLGIARYAATHGPWTFFMRHGGSGAFEPLQKMSRWDYDGIIAGLHDKEFAEKIRSLGIVAVNISPSPGFPTVTIDSVAAGRLAAEHLIKQGHKRFGYFGISYSDHSWLERTGFIEAVRRAGVIEKVYEPAPLERMPVRWKSVTKLLARWLPSLPKPIGVLACDDERGRQIIEAARECGVLVPNEVAVIGISNDELTCEFCNPPLSSITVQGERLGHEAARLLDRLMKGGAAPAKPILIPPGEVVVRRSSDVLAVADEDLAAAVRFIREHGNKAIGVDDVLDEIAISRRSLERRFRDVVGHSPWREIRIAQIAHVKKLLVQTNMPVNRIAAASAFSNPMRLCRIFKEETKMTPTEYRQKFGAV